MRFINLKSECNTPSLPPHSVFFCITTRTLPKTSKIHSRPILSLCVYIIPNLVCVPLSHLYGYFRLLLGQRLLRGRKSAKKLQTHMISARCGFAKPNSSQFLLLKNKSVTKGRRPLVRPKNKSKVHINLPLKCFPSFSPSMAFDLAGL